MKLSLLLPMITIGALAITATSSARADDAAEATTAATTPAKESPNPPSSVRLKLALGGVAVAGGAYAMSYAMASNFPEVPGMGQLKIPVVGPWLALGKSGCATDDPDCGAKVVLRGFFLVIDGLAQIGGLGLIAESVLMKTDATAPKKAAAFTIRPTPLVGGSVTGLGFVGTF
jgi:hypothetical protein